MKARSYTKPSRPSVIEKRLRRLQTIATEAYDFEKGHKVKATFARQLSPLLDIAESVMVVIRNLVTGRR
jgi:hypothetical protein